MAEIVITNGGAITEIGEDLTVYWMNDKLFLTQRSSGVTLNEEETQNLMNYLEGKRPKMVWE